VGLVHVVFVVAAPAEGLAGGVDLHAVGVDAAAVEQVDVVLGEIVSDHAHQGDVGEIGGGDGGVGAASAERLLHFAEGGADMVQSKASNNEYGHEWCASLCRPERRIPKMIGAGTGP